ncbi:MAG TPA: tetratricopeptide repeat protein [Phycisphaerae bacterium]|nr:tetratricopeptide repeat protein [Phycisphaerae bacterium]HRW55193.1 tetratricopeptide repeat protein [Phycisphaerae bacterium]
MTTHSATVELDNARSAIGTATISGPAVRSYAFPTPSFVMTLAMLALIACPRIYSNARLTASIAGVGGVLLVWQLALWLKRRGEGRAFGIEFLAVKAHYLQACVQLGILVWWGLYAPSVLKASPLIVAQVLFLYSLDAVISWTRGWNWRLGFGPLPIIFSTNLLLWFRDDWFYLQFLMVAFGALGKQFVQWRHEGRRRHIFNPSVFGQSLFAIALIVTGLTNDLTLGREIASSFETPHMLLVIFLLGLIVQYHFHVTLMTLSAAIVLVVANLIYTRVTGVYFFVSINVAAPIFLGIHLLITDPSTSPRTNLGRILFGGFYGLGYILLFRMLDNHEVPTFWDKLLPVPILNLLVPAFDRLARAGLAGRLNRWWEGATTPARLNLAHMGVWIALFSGMYATGFIDGPHEGNSISFWKKAIVEGRPHAGHSLVMVAGALAEGGHRPSAFNELGWICANGLSTTTEGEVVRKNSARAATYFATACEMGDMNGCANVVVQHVFRQAAASDEAVARALDRLEAQCDDNADPLSCYLVGAACETGRGRPVDPAAAIRYYERCGDNLYASKGVARVVLSHDGVNHDLRAVSIVLGAATKQRDAESAWYLAYMFHRGLGVPQDERKARILLRHACTLGLDQACDAANASDIPPYENPPMNVPGWLTAYPVQ